MKTFELNELKDLLNLNNTTQPKAKYSNNLLLTMLDHLNKGFTATVEPTKKGFLLNRGSLAECIIKYKVTSDSVKSEQNQADLDTSNLSQDLLAFYDLPRSKNIEIKFSTSFAPATHKSNKARYVIIVSQLGIHLIESKNLVYTKAGKLNISNQKAKDLKELVNLESELGLI